MQLGVNFRGNGVLPSLYYVVVTWLRLNTPIDCIPHPYSMYTKWLTPWDAVDGNLGMHLCRITCAGGGEFLEKWGMTEPVWCCKIVVEASNPHWLHPTSILDVKSVLAPWDGVDGHMGTHLCRIICAVWGWILGEMGYGRACMMLQCHGWGC